jgi:hypothetical protein
MRATIARVFLFRYDLKVGVNKVLLVSHGNVDWTDSKSQIPPYQFLEVRDLIWWASCPRHSVWTVASLWFTVNLRKSKGDNYLDQSHMHK